MLCIEQNDEWLVGCAYLSAESISLILAGAADHTDKIEQELAEVGGPEPPTPSSANSTASSCTTCRDLTLPRLGEQLVSGGQRDHSALNGVGVLTQ
jgi:hypothetical protein